MPKFLEKEVKKNFASKGNFKVKSPLKGMGSEVPMMGKKKKKSKSSFDPFARAMNK